MASVFRVRDRKTGKHYPSWRFKYKNASNEWVYGVGWPDKKQTLEHALSVEAEHRAIRKGEKAQAPAWLKNRNTPIMTVITDFMAWGRTSGGRIGPWSPKNADTREKYLKWWAQELNINVLADIELGKVEKIIQALLDGETHWQKCRPEG